MNDKDEIQELIPAYALGILDAEEAAAVEALLAESHSAREELAQYQQVSDLMGMAAAPVQTSADFEDRLFARIKPAADTATESAKVKPVQQPAPVHQPSFMDRLLSFLDPPAMRLATGLAALIFLVAAGFLFSQNQNLSNQIAETDENLPTIQLASVETASSAVGMMILSQNGANGTIVVDGLAAPGDGQVHRLWMYKDGNVDAGPVLELNPRGYSASWIRTSTPLDSYDRFEVTVELAGNESGVPEGDVVLSWSSDG
ncbi:MAG: anti-sigma factor [Chloroflexota bacterium]